MTPLTEPQQSQQYVDADGRLTTAGIIMLTQMFKRMQDLEERLAALEP